MSIIIMRRWRTGKRIDGGDRGFTLLEVLVALSILGMAATIVFQLFSADLRALRASEDYVAATVRAETRMRELVDDDALPINTWTETTADGYSVDVAVSEVLQERTKDLPVQLLEVALTVHWMKNSKPRRLTVRTMKMIERRV